MTSLDDIYIYTIVNLYVSIVALEDEFSHVSILRLFGLQQYTSSIVQKTSSFILLVFFSTIEI